MQDRSKRRKYARLDAGDSKVTYNEQHEQPKDCDKLQLDTDEVAGKEHEMSFSCIFCKVLY